MHLQKCPVKGRNHARHIFRHYGSALMFYSLQILHLYSRRLTLVSESYTLWAQDSSGAINKQSKRKDDGIVHLKKILFTSGHQEVTLIHTSLLHVQTTCTHTHTKFLLHSDAQNYYYRHSSGTPSSCSSLCTDNVYLT